MIQTKIQASDGSFLWLDITSPSKEDLERIARQYGLHSTSIQDCLEPQHLPKHERFNSTVFMILRIFDPQAAPDADTVQELTRKIAIFQGEGFLITVHRTDWPFLEALRASWKTAEPNLNADCQPVIVNELIRNAILSYEKPLEQAGILQEELEERIFRSNISHSILEEGYYLKRKASTFRRMLRLSLEVLHQLSTDPHPPGAHTLPFYRDLRETAGRLSFFADELWDNVNSLLNLHLSLSSNRTNEVVRVLTLFSVFFLPLTFIAGIYGMNFEHMPELRHPWGYPGTLLAMLAVCAGILLWFRHKGWLR